nr:hypothetical protein [Tanacetum cinerariifolium]
QEAAAARAEVSADSPVLISISQDAPSTSIPLSQAQEHSPIISQARTPQQNGVVERRNQTLFEAA